MASRSFEGYQRVMEERIRTDISSNRSRDCALRPPAIVTSATCCIPTIIWISSLRAVDGDDDDDNDGDDDDNDGLDR